MASNKELRVLMALLVLNASLVAFLNASSDSPTRGLPPPSAAQIDKNEISPLTPKTQQDNKSDQEASLDGHFGAGDIHAPSRVNGYLQENFINKSKYGVGQQTTNSKDSVSKDKSESTTNRNILNVDEVNVNIKNRTINETVDNVGVKPSEGHTTMNDVHFRDANHTHRIWSVSDAFQNGGWEMVRSKMLQAIGVLFNQGNKRVASSVKRLLGLIDKIYYHQDLLEKLEPSLLAFFYDQFNPKVNHLVGILRSFLSAADGNISVTDWSDVVQIFASMTAQISIAKVQNMVKEYLSVKDLKQYYYMLLETNAMEAQALDFVLNLFPDSARVESGRAFHKGSRRSSYELKTKLDHRDADYGFSDEYYDRGDRGYRHDGGGYKRSDGGYGYSDGGYGRSEGGYGHSDGGYGHSSGGYGHSGGGYGQSMYYPQYKQTDPYLLLAGLGAATLLAYIAYRVLVTTTTTTTTEDPTTDGRRRRDLELLGEIDFDHLPTVLYTINNMIETAAVKYEDAEDLGTGLNSLWRTRQEGSCMSCALQDKLGSNADHLSMKPLLMAAAAQLMGAEKTGQLLDKLTAPVVGPERTVQMLDELKILVVEPESTDQMLDELNASVDSRA